jgi:hypothetical protein
MRKRIRLRRRMWRAKGAGSDIHDSLEGENGCAAKFESTLMTELADVWNILFDWS